MTRKWVVCWGPVLAWMILIFALSSFPDAPQKQGLPRLRNRQMDERLRSVAHVGEYAVLGGLVWRGGT